MEQSLSLKVIQFTILIEFKQMIINGFKINKY